jgi:hypothetical protein
METIDWSASHNGVMLCTIEQTLEFMPETKPVLDSLIPHLQYDKTDYFVDVKVHMLMPGQYPCIPNWHCDFIPRNEDKVQLHDDIRPKDLMYLWCSGEPRTQFKSFQGTVGEPYKWIVFNQQDEHRGIKSEIHTWRCFIRLIPKWFIHPGTKNVGTIRRHSQVYIDDPDLFRW